MNMVERVARAIAMCEGGRIVGPAQCRAQREFGWRGDGWHLQQFAEAHWREYAGAASMAIAAMREPTPEMIEASNREWDGRMSHRSSGAWEAMIDAAQETSEAT